MEEGVVLEHDGEWHEVTRKKRRNRNGGMGKKDVILNSKRSTHQKSISLYFSEFPETHGAKKVLRAFMLYGEAMEVVIPVKRNKRGRRFGFVRFFNVLEPRVFAIKLDNIIISANKIHVNLSRLQIELNDQKPTHYGQQHELVAQPKFQTIGEGRTMCVREQTKETRFMSKR